MANFSRRGSFFKGIRTNTDGSNKLVFVFIACLLLFVCSSLLPTVNKTRSPNGHELSPSNHNNAELNAKKQVLGVKCPASQAEERGNFLRTYVREHPRLFECPNHVWLDAMEAMEGLRPHLFINIGANKGYNLVDLVNRFCPELDVEPTTWGDYLKDNGNIHECGSCGDCQQAKRPSKAARPKGNANPECKLGLIGYEPGTTFQPVKDAIESFFGVKGAPDAKLPALFERKAFSNQVATVQFPRCNPGDETCFIGLQRDANTEFDEIPSTTLDSEIEPQSMKTIDGLLIDTEGYDPAVLDAGGFLLSQQRVRVLAFEYHGMNYWARPDVTLENYVDRLDKAGYDCFFDADRLFKLTGCWSALMEFKQWSNAVCILRSETQLLEFLEKNKLIF